MARRTAFRPPSAIHGYTAYHEAKRLREVSRIQLKLQTVMRIGEQRGWTELKREIANNTLIAIFEEALYDLADVGIIELKKAHTKKGRRPILVTYRGYVTDSPDYSKQSFEAHLAETGQAEEWDENASYFDYLAQNSKVAGHDTEHSEEE